jgi:hypothetical protein
MRRHAGKYLSTNLASAMIQRLRTRIGDFLDVRDGGAPNYDARAESKLAARCVRLVAATAVVVVLFTVTRSQWSSCSGQHSFAIVSGRKAHWRCGRHAPQRNRHRGSSVRRLH